MRETTTDPTTCPACKGTGEITIATDGPLAGCRGICVPCDGTGQDPAFECTRCDDGLAVSDTCDDCGHRHCPECEPCAADPWDQDDDDDAKVHD